MRRVRRYAVWAAIVCALVSHGAVIAPCQAVDAADRRAEISGFFGAGSLRTDYSTRQENYIFGLDYTRFLKRFYLAPSLELRGSVSPTRDLVGQSVYSGGMKVEHPYGRFHPYADLLVGKGKVSFANETPISDDSIVYTYGGGVDVDVAHHFAFKVEAEGSHWHVGKMDDRNPAMIEFGVVYRVPFHPRYLK